ncbi:translocase of outer mitochondrial membrane [Chytridiales sp. JEL 0842]|nr:translocase of outer mitochondrial membrane [Chytridiales sp. JEL 0842]
MESFIETVTSPFASLANAITEIKKRNQLRSPGAWENLHREIKGTLPTIHMIDGAKFDITSVLSPAFQVTHSFSWGSAQYPSNYSFGAGYQGSKYLLHGQVDHDGNLQARANFFWKPPGKLQLPHLEPHAHLDSQTDPNLPAGVKEETPAAPAAANPNEPAAPPVPPPSIRPSNSTKIQAQLSKTPGQSMIQFEQDMVGETMALNFKAMNPNPFDAPSRGFSAAKGGQSAPTTLTGTFSAAYLQSITKSWALGGEMVVQRADADTAEQVLTLAARWSPPAEPLPSPSSLPAGMPSPYMPINPVDPTQVFTTSYSPSTGIIHSSYWRRLNQRLEVATEVQMLIVPGGPRTESRREGIATAGFKLDTIFATIRGALDTTGRVSAVVEERIAPGLSFQICGEIDYSKVPGGQGRVGLGFTLEA